MINVNAEDLVSFAEAARMRPPGRNGRPMHTDTVRRHALKGIRGVRLEHVRLGGSLYTSRQATQRFAERLTAASPDDMPHHRPNDDRDRARESAAERLDRIGI